MDVLADRIKEVWRAKNAVIRPGTKDVIAAVGGFTNSISEHSLTWYQPQTVLDESAPGTAIKRPIGGRVRLWRRQQSAGRSLCAGAVGHKDL